MAVRPAFRLLLKSEQNSQHPLYLTLDERGGESDRSIHLTVAGAGLEPYENDPTLELSLDEAGELRDCLDSLIAA
ncbi:MAG TPA: hypothetical protein VIS95_02020 [Solirubrobacterales bacterium]